MLAKLGTSKKSAECMLHDLYSTVRQARQHTYTDQDVFIISRSTIGCRRPRHTYCILPLAIVILLLDTLLRRRIVFHLSVCVSTALSKWRTRRMSMRALRGPVNYRHGIYHGLELERSCHL